MNEPSLSGMTANTAVFFSPRLHSSISSVWVIPARDSRLNFSNLDTNVIWIDFKVLPLPL